MAADKFYCPNCGNVSTVIQTVLAKKGTTRYRKCRSCGLHFQTKERVMDTPKLRQAIGKPKADPLFDVAPFKYRKTPRKIKKNGKIIAREDDHD